MTRVLAVSSQKGGIGKATMAANLAIAWGLMGRRVLAIDLDPQFAMTRRFDRAPGDAAATAFELLAGEGELDGAVLIDVEPGVDLLAGRRDLAKLELSLAGEHHRETFLARSARRLCRPLRRGCHRLPAKPRAADRQRTRRVLGGARPGQHDRRRRTARRR
ncbi:MAG TPA: AAA family ATPase [Solirubrobacteraceae bacterium]|jgi:cellulose biosynthesis protein BcsQ